VRTFPGNPAVLIVTGCWMALLAEQEAFLVKPVFLILLGLYDPHVHGAARGVRWSKIMAAAFLPPLGAYLLLGSVVGYANLADALRGYGLATVPCAWWPTGLGVFGALAARGAAGLVGGAVWLGYEWYADGSLLTVPVFISVRSLFGSTLSPMPEVPALSYPFLALLGPYLLARGLEFPQSASPGVKLQGNRVAMQFASTLVIAYAVLHVAAAYPNLLSNRSFTMLDTESGTARVLDGKTNAKLYGYVLDHGRHNRVFSNQFAQIPLPERFQAEDLARIRNNPPRLGVAVDEPNLSWTPQSALPVTEFLTSNYHTDRKIGSWLLLGRNAK
jgi:hypothetical protein